MGTMNARRLLAVLLALGAAQSVAQTAPRLPRTQGDIRALLRETGDPICLRCGVVTSVRVVDAAGAGTNSQINAPPLHGSSNLDTGVGTVPFGGERARFERDRLRQGPAPHYEVTVRYDDGSYGRVELAHDPGLKRDERVKVDGGSVTRYP